MLGTLAPTHGFLSRPAFTGPYWPMTRHVASRVTSPLHLGPHPLITAHAFDHFIHVPSFQAGPLPRPDSYGPDFISRPPIRRGPLPVPDSEGPSALGPALLLLTAHAMDRGTRSTNTTGPAPVRASLTAIARSAFVDLLAQQPAGAGEFDRGARSTGGHGSRGQRLPRQAPRRLRHIAPRRDESSAGGEGLPQTTPLLSVRGCEWGPTPLSSMNTMSSR